MRIRDQGYQKSKKIEVESGGGREGSDIKT